MLESQFSLGNMITWNILALPLRATVLQLDFGSVKMEKKFYYI